MAENKGNRIKSSEKRARGKKSFNIKKLMVVSVAMVISVYFVYVLIWQQVTITRKNQEIDALKSQVETATEESERLSQEIENLNDPGYLERIAREKLGLVRPNERVFVDSNKSEDNDR